MARTKKKNRRMDPDVINVAIPRHERDEFEAFAVEHGLRLKQVPSVLWRAFKALPPAQQESTAKEFRRSLVTA